MKHPTKRNAFEVIVDVSRPFKDGFVQRCPTCLTGHTHKTYHILLNSDGIAVLSPKVYEGVLRAGMGELVFVDHIDDPPSQIMGTKGGVMGIVPQRDKTVIYHR